MTQKSLKVYLLASVCCVFILSKIVNCEDHDKNNKSYFLDKQKLGRSAQKKQTFVKPSQKPIALPEKSKFTPKKESGAGPGAEMEDSETDRLCLSMAEDSVPDFLTKFGLITHLIHDVNSFRAEVKASRSRQLERTFKSESDEDIVRGHLKKGKYSKHKFYKHSQLDRQYTQSKAQGIGLGPEVPIRANPPRNNFLYPRQSKNQDTVPTCFGYEYLTAVDAFDRDTQSPDVETLQGALSDILSMKLTSKLSEIFENCSDSGNDENLPAVICPIVEIHTLDSKSGTSAENYEQTSEMRPTCEENCFTDKDCGSSGEKCCPNDCGGHSCHVPRKWLSAKQKSLESQCGKSDTFMQCIYDQIKEKVCPALKPNKN